MTSRLDRLLILLDTGSSTSVRTTAAKQLAQLAAKSVRSDVGNSDELSKTYVHVSQIEPSEWAELMSVVARVLPYLHSKSHDTRSAAAVALSQICTLVPLWQPSLPTEEQKPIAPLATPEFPQFSVKQLMESGTLLLASSGKEFVRPTFANAAEVQRARKAAMGRLGLDFLDNVAGSSDDMDWEKELASGADQDVDMKPADTPQTEEFGQLKREPSAETTIKPELSPHSRPTSETPTPAEEDLSGLSARERNRLKRKRKPGNSAFVAAPPPPPQSSGSKYNATPSGSSKARIIASDGQPSRSRLDDTSQSPVDNTSEQMAVDPTKGGAVEAKSASAQLSKALEVQTGRWVWDGVVKVLEVDLFSAAWQVRHGAAMAMREVLNAQGKYGGMRAGLGTEENEINHEAWCNNLAAKLLCIFVLDRFGDFVSDQVVAPVRETASQTLAALLRHMPKRSVLHVHSILLQMIKQDFTLKIVSVATGKSKASKNGASKGVDKPHVWEVRHAGLLGIKYEVAVRTDLVEDSKVKSEDADQSGKDILTGVVDAAVLGLGDSDDDVRSVAASCLLPITSQLVDQLPEELPRVLAVLWNCLGEMKDDLGSSVGAVMDLLGQLVSYDRVIDIIAQAETSQPLSSLAPMLFPFFRHTITSVRLAVVKTLHTFLTVPSLPRDWITQPFLRLLIQNLVVEEKADIREASLILWRSSLPVLHSTPGWMEALVIPQMVLEWYTLVMTPLGVPIDPLSLFHPSIDADGHGAIAEKHNVDKSMLAQDLALVSVEVILKARVAAATALALLIAEWSNQDTLDDMFRPMLEHYIHSPSMLQKFLAAIVVEEWSRRFEEIAQAEPERVSSKSRLVETSVLATDLGKTLLMSLQSEPPVAYHEMALSLSRIFAECTSLLQAFVHDCKVPQASVPFIGSTIDINGTQEHSFTIETANSVVGPTFTKLKESLGRTKKKELASISEKRLKVVTSIERYVEVKASHDTRVHAAFAAAFVALKVTPDKVSPIVKGIMNGIKNEENVDLQTRSAAAVASFIDFCTVNKLSQPPEKIVKNLCTFLCQDSEQTPTFSYTKGTEKGILSFDISMNGDGKSNGKTARGREGPVVESQELFKARLSHRGAKIAFVELSKKFGSHLFDLIPKMWEFIAGGLLMAYKSDSPEDGDKLMDKRLGQDVIDSLSVLRVAAGTLHEDLSPRLVGLLSTLSLPLRSRFAIIRQCTARCFASICNVITPQAMRQVVEDIVPYLGDSLSITNRQGATELIYHIVQELDMKALPYVIFLIVPILGRMSDSDDATRATATNIFASLVKMVPLEAGLPDPPDFSEELLQRRDAERQFLNQLLDGTRVEEYAIPVPIKAELRKYQREGVNWLAFLAKYQLHGILCDDMGLGKTLQSICILASKHHERAEKYNATKSPDSVHLPSLIVCPPTLTGHWYYEILKYTDGLRPAMYVGSARERSRLLSKVAKYDVIITSYEVVRNDIANLQDIDWHYCILDEGHIIKNAKTKLTKAVKSIRAHHRLILSGTPIQNNVLELWSLFDFLMPGFLGNESSFNERYSKPILANRDGKSKNSEAAALALESLHKQVLPFLLRRLKENVLDDLPPKIIQDYYCELSDLQKHLYDDYSNSQAHSSAEGALQMAKPDSSSGDQKHVFQSLQYLRKLCNHPALVLKNNAEAIKAALSSVQKNVTDDSLHDIQHAPKLLALKQLLVDCGIGGGSSQALGAENGKTELLDADEPSSGVFSQHRVLIFCQLKQMLDIIETDLFKRHMPSVTYMRLDGDTDPHKRHAIVQTFNGDPSIDCLLLTTHVGGLGLTLTGADTVIFVEHDWNPMKDLQAMDRAHRIGQKKVVNVYRLVTKGTLEEKIMGLQRFKLNVANSVVTQQNAGLASMDTDRVLDLFKRTTEDEDAATAKKRNEKKQASSSSHKNVLEGLDDLPAEEEYEDLSLSSFMGSLRG